MPSFFKKVKDFLGGPSPWNDEGPGFDTPKDPNSVRWDPETGLPIGLGGPPDHRFAQRYQYKANEVTAQRNAQKRDQAYAFLRQGARAAGSTRPGGNLSATLGFYDRSAQLSASDQIEAPDVLGGYREHARIISERNAKRAAIMGTVGQLFGSFAKIGAAAATGGASTAAEAGANAAAPAPATLEAPQGGLNPAYNDTGEVNDQTLAAESGGIGGTSRAGGGGYDPYSLASTLHFDEGSSFYDGADDAMDRMMSQRMSNYGA